MLKKKEKKAWKGEVGLDAQAPVSLQVCVEVLVDGQLQRGLLHAAAGGHAVSSYGKQRWFWR